MFANSERDYRMSGDSISRILICDDDAPFRKRLARSLRDRNVEVYEAESATSALQVACEYEPDGILVDLRMPGESGLWLISEIKRKEIAARIVVLTGFGSITTALEATRRGAINYLTKPVTANQILTSFFPRIVADSPEVAMPSLAQVEAEYVHRVLDEFGGNVSQSAKILGVHRRSLQRKLKR